MAIWYKTGTVAVTNGLNIVTGTGTLFTLNASIGDVFYGPDSKEYEITAVSSDTSLSIATPLGVAAYQGATLSAQPYAIIRNFTASVNATLASKLTNLLNTWQTREDEFRIWHGGTANGGAAFDGNYPLTDAVGVAQAIASPAKLQLLAGGQVKQAVKAASTADLALTGNQTVDGIALVTNNRCLVKNQTTGSQNGIYLVATGAWTRAADFDISADAYPQCLVPVEQGTVNLDTIWMLTTNSPITLGTTALVFAKVYPDPSIASILAGTAGFEAGNTKKLNGITATPAVGGAASTLVQLDASGNLLVGVANGNKHIIQKNVNALAMEILNTNTGAAASVIETNCAAVAASTWTFIDGYSSIAGTPSQRYYIHGDGNFGSATNVYGAISDVKLKENIVPARNYLDDLCRVSVKKYSMIEEHLSEANQLGVIAQELEQIFPNMVTESPDFGFVDTINETSGKTTREKVPTGTTTKSVKYSIFVPMLITAVQELAARLAVLEAK